MSLASLRAWCDSKMGLDYSTSYSRFGYSDPEHYDCSGLVWRGCNDNGFPLEASVSWTIQLEGERLGLTCSKEYAMSHIAIAVHGGNTSAGGGKNGHVCFTDGHGRTWEAMGTNAGCRKGTIGRRFEYFMRLPGAVDVPAPIPIELEEPNMILFLRNATKGGPGDIWAVVGGRPIYMDTDRALTEMQNIAATFGQKNWQPRDTDPNVLKMLGCVR